MAQLMPLPLTVSCFSKIQIGFTFLVQAHLGSPGKRAVKEVCVVCWLSREDCLNCSILYCVPHICDDPHTHTQNIVVTVGLGFAWFLHVF